MPIFYQSGEEIRKGDRVLLHGEPGKIQFVIDHGDAAEGYPVDAAGRGIMVQEPKYFGLVFLAGDDIGSYEDLEFVSRAD